MRNRIDTKALLSREEAAARNRAEFPTAAAFVDEMRAVFGPGVSLVHAEENGRVIGAPCPVGVQPVLAPKPLNAGKAHD